MGLWDKFVDKVICIDRNFLEIVEANDRGEEWAREIIHKRWCEEPNFLKTLSQARVQLYADAARKGSEDAQYWLGVSEAQLGNIDESYYWLSNLANKGNIKAMNAIASEYTEFGNYGNDEKKVFEWHLKAANAGDPSAQCAVALDYFINENYEEALKWYGEAARQSYSEGCLGYGKVVDTKRGRYYENYSKEEIKKMNTIIEHMFIDAINFANNRDDYSDAANSLGWFYRREKDIKRAIYFFSRAYKTDNDKRLAYQEAMSLCKEYNIDVNSIDELGKELFGE